MKHIYSLETNQSELIFLTAHSLHRSVIDKEINLNQGYRIDIRYY